MSAGITSPVPATSAHLSSVIANNLSWEFTTVGRRNMSRYYNDVAILQSFLVALHLLYPYQSLIPQTHVVLINQPIK